MNGCDKIVVCAFQNMHDDRVCSSEYIHTYYRTMRFMRMYNRAPISASSRCLGSPTSFISSPPNDMYTALHSKQA